ncbi:MAG: hypothetical protein ACUVX8_07770 [Candidatus Zipacnadales bacterium]
MSHKKKNLLDTRIDCVDGLFCPAKYYVYGPISRARVFYRVTR